MISSINNKCLWAQRSCDWYMSVRLFSRWTRLCEQYNAPLWLQVYGRLSFQEGVRVPFSVCSRCGVQFHVVSTSCLCWWLPHNHNWKAITRLSGNWRCHIGFQQEIRRGACLFAADVDAGKPETAFQEKNVLLQTLSLWLLSKHWSVSRTPGALQLLIKGVTPLLLPWLQVVMVHNHLKLE